VDGRSGLLSRVGSATFDDVSIKTDDPAFLGGNRPPVANHDAATTPAGIPVTFPVLSNDTDPDNNPLTVASVTQPANGAVFINSNNTLTYTPKAGFVGTDSFTYKASDGVAQSNVATVTVQVNGASSGPLAANDSASTNKGSPVTVSVLANDTDPNGDVLRVVGLTQPTSGGTVTLNANGTITYSPKAGFAGTDTFTYRAHDGQSESNLATVTITVLNRAPVALSDTASTSRNSAVTISVLSNDSDPDKDPLTLMGLTQPANGTLALNANGTITYTPKRNFTGTDTFTYKVSDGTLQSGAATVTVTVR
jgi:hypothetical protein